MTSFGSNDCNQFKCTQSCIGMCRKACSKCFTKVKVITISPNGTIISFGHEKFFKKVYNLKKREDFELVKKQLVVKLINQVVDLPEQQFMELWNADDDDLNDQLANIERLNPPQEEEHKVIFEIPVCNGCKEFNLIFRARWLKYWETTIRLSKLPTAKKALSQLRMGTTKRKNVEQFLTFIECIPLRFQHGAMYDALSTLFVQAYDW